MSIRNSLLRTYFARRMKAIDRFRRHPDQVQAEMFRQLIARGADTEFGRRHGVAKHLTPEAFAARVGVQDYESFKPYIERMLAGEKNVAAPGRVTLFARSSGTTSDRSKFIPVTRESVWWNHTLGMRDVAAVYASAKPQTKIFDGKTLTLGGSYVRENGALIGGSVGCADQSDSVLERLVPGAEDGDGSDSGFRPEDRGDLPGVYPGEDHGLCRRAFVEPGADAPGVGIYGQEQPARSVARSGIFCARGRGVYALPQVVRQADPVGGDDLSGNIQRFGGFFSRWPTI